MREPGLTWVNPFTDRLTKVNMQITAVQTVVEVVGEKNSTLVMPVPVGQPDGDALARGQLQACRATIRHNFGWHD